MDLYARTERIYFDGGYRDIPVHEVLGSELRWWRTAPWLFGSLGLIVGYMVGAIVVGIALYPQAGSHFENEAEKSHQNTQATSDG